MKDTLLAEILRYTDSTFDCKFEDNLHNITIDADGSLRTCLRIRGDNQSVAMNLIDPYDASIRIPIKKMIVGDKRVHCEGCNWPCVMMSKMLAENEQLKTTLIHEEERKR